jgi:uncharacterized membrane protein
VWAAVVLIPLTGYAMLFRAWGGMGGAPLYVHIMNGLGLLMVALYLHVFFAPYRKLKQAVEEEDWQTGGRQVARIRRVVAVNLTIGLVVMAVAVGGRHTAWLAGAP